MWGGDEGLLEELEIDMWFVFPCVDNGSADLSFVQCLEECLFVDYSSSAGVDDDGFPLE